jgi:hypothetical protein
LSRCDLSLVLDGIPLETHPIDSLAQTYGRGQRSVFRIRDENVVGRSGLHGLDVEIEPIAVVVEMEKEVPGDDDDEWVRGLVIANPFCDEALAEASLPEDLARIVSRSEVLICGLGSWHTLARPPSRYSLTRFEWAWTSDALVVHVGAYWHD